MERGGGGRGGDRGGGWRPSEPESEPESPGQHGADDRVDVLRPRLDEDLRPTGVGEPEAGEPRGRQVDVQSPVAVPRVRPESDVPAVVLQWQDVPPSRWPGPGPPAEVWVDRSAGQGAPGEGLQGRVGRSGSRRTSVCGRVGTRVDPRPCGPVHPPSPAADEFHLKPAFLSGTYRGPGSDRRAEEKRVGCCPGAPGPRKNKSRTFPVWPGKQHPDPVSPGDTGLTVPSRPPDAPRIQDGGGRTSPPTGSGTPRSRDPSRFLVGRRYHRVGRTTPPLLRILPNRPL